jgi:hypothetical protein
MLRLALILLLLPSLLSAQNQLLIGGVEASAYPELRLSLRLSLDGEIVYPIDASRLLLRENGRVLSAGLDCPAASAERPSLSIGFERSLDANFPKAQAAARAFLERLRFTDDGVEASLWSFATSVDQETAMTRDSTRLRRALDALSVAAWPFNGTALYETMHRAIEDVNAAGSGTRKAVVFFTDGTNNSSLYGRSWDDVRGRAAVDGIRIYVVLVKNRDEGEQAMRTLTEASGGFMVYESDTVAADTVYRALVAADPARQWCIASTRSPFCANGQMRQVEIGYVLANGDTLWDSANYQAPWIADDLRPLSIWCSPPAPLPGDPATPDEQSQRLAVGIRLDGGWQPPDFTIAVPLGGLRLESGEAGVWPVDIRVAGDEVLLDVSPPAAGLTDGWHTLALLTLRGNTPREAWQPRLIADASGCLRIESVTRPAIVRVSLDTALAERGGEARLQLRIDASDIPEGAQLLAGTVAVDSTLARFDAAAPIDPASLPAGWTLRGGVLRLVGSEEILEWEAGGPAIDGAFTLGTLSLRASFDPAYLRPVTLRAATANLHATTPEGAGANGLIVIRDSCRNNLVALTGLAPSAPWPQPARDAVSLRFVAASPRTIDVSVIDALGREVLPRRRWSLPAGTSDRTLEVSSLLPGSYTILYHTEAGAIMLPLVVLR